GLAQAEKLLQGPCDELTFAIGVGREVDRLGLAARALVRPQTPLLLLLLRLAILSSWSSASFFSIGTYCGAKPFLTSTPSPFCGRSMMCPIEARTSKTPPKNFSIVVAFAGDSTMTRFFAIRWLPHVFWLCDGCDIPGYV